MRNENEEMNNGLRRVAMAVALGVLLVLAGCSSEELGSSEKPAGTEADGNTIVLGVKEVRSAVTRSQHTGSMDFTQLKSTGFGVYGYQGAYNSSTSKPTLFATGANTKVTFETGGTDPTTALVHPGSWKYAETAANQKEWVTTDKYTFFAYAPYMASAGTEPGITSISTGNGDPTIGYTVAEAPAQSVDLLWGVRSDSEAKSGLPWLDCTQTETASTVLFTFCHALCAVGFHAQVMADQTNDTDNLGDVSTLGTIGSADGCKVTLRSITLTPAGFPDKDPVVAATPFHESAVLNLNNTTKFQPKWSGYSGTIASLALDAGEIDIKLLDPVANLGTDDYYSEGTTLNPNGTKTEVMSNSSVPGITETANSQAVIAGDNVFMFIPQAAQDYTVTVQYYMTYKTGVGTYHRQSFEGTATLRNIELMAGVKYYFNLVFGLTTFKVSVDAVDWDESTSSVTIATETGTSASNSLAREMRSED